MSGKIIEQLERIDNTLTENIKHFISPYMPIGEIPELTLLLPQLIKITIYTIFLILPFGILKLFYPYNKFITIVLFLFLLVLSFSVIGIFFGLFQALYM